MKASYSIEWSNNKAILIKDLALIKGTMSITNDAEEVIENLIMTGRIRDRVFYRDTNGDVDELVHDGKEFKAFMPGTRGWRISIDRATLYMEEC